jgi:hypothetical protein
MTTGRTPLGNLVLIRPLMLMIIPLIFVSVVCGVTSIGDPSKLGGGRGHRAVLLHDHAHRGDDRRGAGDLDLAGQAA